MHVLRVPDIIWLCLEPSLVRAGLPEDTGLAVEGGRPARQGRARPVPSISAGIFLRTCTRPRVHNIISKRNNFEGSNLENLYCLRCNQELGPGQKSVAIYMFSQTVGIRPRQKSTSQRICFCPQCSVSLAMGPPPEGALNIAAWQMIRDLVGSDPALNQAAWENLRGVAGLLPATGTEGNDRSGRAGYFEF